MAPDRFRDVLARLLAEGRGGLRSKNALAKRWVDLYGGTRDDARKLIRRHLDDDIEPNEATIERYARAFGIKRSDFPPAVTPRDARARAIREVHERLGQLEAHAPHLRDELDAIRELLPEPPTNPGPPTTSRTRQT